MLKYVASGLLAMSLSAYAAVKEEPVTYKDGDTTMKGFMFSDGKTADNPKDASGLMKSLMGSPFVKPDSIEAFKKEMDAAKVDYKFINYPGAVHAFTNPEASAKGKEFNLPLAYHPEADKQSKAEAAKFFKSVFK